MAAISYFFAPEVQRNSTVYASYWLLLAAVIALTLQTGGPTSPFIALWLVATIFAGIFGRSTLVILFIALNAYVTVILLDDTMTRDRLLGILLAGELPILVSYILWHGKATSEKSKERAYYDLENELTQVSNKSDVVISAISDGVIAVNNEGVIELINPAAQRIVGWGHQDALNLDYKSVLQLLNANGHEVEKSQDPVFSVLTTNQPVKRNDLQLQTNSGKKINCEVVVSPLGRLGSGAIIVFRDVTKEQAEEKAQAEFISTASHEMRTPVASIEGYLGLALNPATANIDEKARDFITKAHESAQHLGRLFQDLLDVTKADDGRLSNNPKVIDAVDFTQGIVESLRQKADEKNLRLFFKPNTISSDEDEGGLRNLAPVFFIDADKDHLREVLSNLVENAIKYTPEGEVVIDVQGDNQHVVISISDSGIGIPAEDIPHLFQKFYRVDNSDTREIGGTGLGLYLCRKLVEAMGGRIWVDSEYKKGSTFSVEMPRISHEDAQRLIEASGAKLTPIEQTGKYITADKLDSTEKERTDALATPIILNHSKPAGQFKPAHQPGAEGTEDAGEISIDPLVGTPVTSGSEQPEPLAPHNGMVLPPSMQAVQSNLQTSTQPPAPAPSPAPAEAVANSEPARLTVPERGQKA